MKEPTIGVHQSIIPDGQPAEIAQPANRAFHDPAAAVPAQPASILVGGPLVVVIGPAGNQPVRPLPRTSRSVWPCHRNRVERRPEEPALRRGCRVQVCSQRSTRAIDQYHPLCALSPLGRPDFRAPFFAGAKLPSTKHSFQRSFWASFNWAKKARHSASSAPQVSHCRSRRQHVLELPYRRGRSLHGAPVQRIHRIPSKQRRASAGLDAAHGLL